LREEGGSGGERRDATAITNYHWPCRWHPELGFVMNRLDIEEVMVVRGFSGVMNTLGIEEVRVERLSRTAESKTVRRGAKPKAGKNRIGHASR
jgi:hypothetical protein